jgi:hypothetical protein
VLQSLGFFEDALKWLLKQAAKTKGCGALLTVARFF